MFTRVPQPLAYAEALLAQFSALSRAVQGAVLLEDFVRGAAQLSGCELSQLYLLDATHSCLQLRAEFKAHIAEHRMATLWVTHDEAEARAMAVRGYRLQDGVFCPIW